MILALQLTKNFVDTMLDTDVPNPVLLVVSAASGGYRMMDGSGQTVSLLIQTATNTHTNYSLFKTRNYNYNFSLFNISN